MQGQSGRRDRMRVLQFCERDPAQLDTASAWACAQTKERRGRNVAVRFSAPAKLPARDNRNFWRALHVVGVRRTAAEVNCLPRTVHHRELHGTAGSQGSEPPPILRHYEKT